MAAQRQDTIWWWALWSITIAVQHKLKLLLNHYFEDMFYAIFYFHKLLHQYPPKSMVDG